MNIRNQMDICLDNAMNDWLKSTFRTFFEDGDGSKLEKELKKVQLVYETANKMLDML